MLRPNGQLSMTAAYEGGATINPSAYHPALGWAARVASQFGAFGKTASLPVGYGGRAIIFPRVAGSVASYRTPVTVNGAAVGALGRNLEASAAIQILADATGGLIAGGTASATVTLMGSAEILAALKGDASATITITGLAEASALGFPAAAATITINAAGQPMGLGFMVATTEDTSTLTPASIAAAVLAASVEGALSLADIQRILLAVAAGNATGLNSSPVFKSQDGTKNRVTGTLSGENRTVTGRDPS